MANSLAPKEPGIPRILGNCEATIARSGSLGNDKSRFVRMVDDRADQLTAPGGKSADLPASKRTSPLSSVAFDLPAPSLAPAVPVAGRSVAAPFLIGNRASLGVGRHTSPSTDRAVEAGARQPEPKIMPGRGDEPVPALHASQHHQQFGDERMPDDVGLG